jgi:DNA processing protein
MTMPDTTTLSAKAILGLMNLPGIAAQAVYKIADRLEAQGAGLHHLLDYDVASLVGDEILDESQAVKYTSESHRRWLDSVIDAMRTDDIQLIPFTSEHYPDHLRARIRSLAPPLLMVAGKIALLHTPGVAFAGARNVSSAGQAISKRLAQAAAARRFTVVSGGARGTDTLAHEEAVNTGGNTIVVLAEGMLTSSARQLVKTVDHGAVAVVSTFLPQGSWHTWRAMGRNNYILGLSDRLVVIEARESGGTLAAGKTSLTLGLDTWVIDYDVPPPTAAGNGLLLDLGAYPLHVTANLEVTIPDGLFALHNWKVNILPAT